MPQITLQSDEVHVWQAALTSSPEIQCLLELLSRDERVWADRFRFAQDRDRYIHSHAFLRMVLGRYLGMDPRRLEFRYGPHGKPALAGEYGAALRFNLSHSQELALLAITRGREVGVDVEYVQVHLPCEQIAQRFFSAEEVAALDALPPSVRPRAFYSLWTRKEAYLKARGDGLAFPPDQVWVSHPDEPPSLLSVGSDLAEAACWSLCDLAPAPGYVGALAVEGRPLRLRQWRWPED